MMFCYVFTGEASEPNVTMIAVIAVVIVILLLAVIMMFVLYKFVYLKKRNSKEPVSAAEMEELKPKSNEERQEDKNTPPEPNGNSPSKDPQQPYEGDLPTLGSKVSTNEKDREENLQLARQDSFNDRKENDPFLPPGGMDLRESDSPPSPPPDADNHQRVQPAYSMNPRYMSTNTRGFLGAQQMMQPGTKMKYTKEDPDGTKRVFEIEKTDAASVPIVREMKTGISQQPTITEVESENEESMTRQDSASSIPKKV